MELAGQDKIGTEALLDQNDRLKEEEMPGVIDFECENDRRIEAGIIADSWRWQNIRLQLNETMATSELPDTLLVSAGLCALLDMLEGDGLSRRDAKAFIARSLNALRE
jgi:hypothetical protein